MTGWSFLVTRLDMTPTGSPGGISRCPVLWFSNVRSWVVPMAAIHGAESGSLLLALFAKVTKTSARKHRNWEVVCGCHLQNYSFIGSVLLIAYNFHLLSIPFAQQHVKCIVNQCCFLSGRFDFTEVWLTWSNIVLFKCSLYFFEQCILMMFRMRIICIRQI